MFQVIKLHTNFLKKKDFKLKTSTKRAKVQRGPQKRERNLEVDYLLEDEGVLVKLQSRCKQERKFCE